MCSSYLAAVLVYPEPQGRDHPRHLVQGKGEGEDENGAGSRKGVCKQEQEASPDTEDTEVMDLSEP